MQRTLGLRHLSVWRSAAVKLRTASRRSVYSAAAIGKDVLDNPFYDKYKSKLDKVQGFPATVEKAEKVKLNSDPPPVQTASNTQSPSLDNVMKVDLIVDKTKVEISKIWVEYHKTKDCISAVMDADSYVQFHAKTLHFPRFVYPLPRDEGYEFWYAQFSGHKCHFTSLIQYQMYQENAPTILTLTHFTELQESKGLVLMLGELDISQLSTFEAQNLANQVQLYYASNQPDRCALVKQFNNNPENFDYKVLLEQLHNANISLEQ